MTFASEKTKASSNRFMLVRITPGRYIGDVLDYVSGLWQVTLPFECIADIKRNGASLTADTTTPTVNDHYYYNETTKLLKIKLSSAPDYETNVIIAYHHLFYTGEKTRYATEDPEDALTQVRKWPAKIERYPSLSSSIEDIGAGILSISSTNIEIINTDNFLQGYLSENDSFSNKQILVWQCINDVSNIKKVYDGKIKSLSLDSKSVRFSIYDPFSLLQQTAYMGDRSDEAIFRHAAGSFPNIRPEDHDKPYPFVFGPSRAVISNDVTYAYGYLYKFVVDGNLAVCTDYEVTGSNATNLTKNRSWGLCRTAATPANQTFGSITRSLVGSNGIKFYYISGHDIHIGETVIGINGGTTLYGICVNNVDQTISGNIYNLMVQDTDTVTIATSFTAHAAPAIFVMKSGWNHPIAIRYLRDYTYNSMATSGGNKSLSIDFFSDFEANATGVGLYAFGTPPNQVAINPDTDKILYVVYRASSDTHGSALKKIVEKAGLAANAASFTAADAALTANAVFQIPEYDETEYKDYRNYCQLILKSVMGYLKINEDLETEYHLLAAPSGTDTINSGKYLNNSLSIDIDYNDIVTEVIGYNPHVQSAENMDATETAFAGLASAKAKYLHGIDKVISIRHVLNRFDAAVQAHLFYGAERRAKYTFKTATQNLDSLLGDDLKLESDILLGTDSATHRDLKIIGLQKTGTDCTVTCDDIGGL